MWPSPTSEPELLKVLRLHLPLWFCHPHGRYLPKPRSVLRQRKRGSGSRAAPVKSKQEEPPAVWEQESASVVRYTAVVDWYTHCLCITVTCLGRKKLLLLTWPKAPQSHFTSSLRLSSGFCLFPKAFPDESGSDGFLLPLISRALCTFNQEFILVLLYELAKDLCTSVPLTLDLGMMGSLLSSRFRCHLLRETFSDHCAPRPQHLRHPLHLLSTVSLCLSHPSLSGIICNFPWMCLLNVLVGNSWMAWTLLSWFPLYPQHSEQRGVLAGPLHWMNEGPELCLSAARQLPFSKGPITSSNKKGSDSWCYTLRAWPLTSVCPLNMLLPGLLLAWNIWFLPSSPWRLFSSFSPL